MIQDSKTYDADSYKSATGTIRYTFLNDVMFKISFQKRKVLDKFLCSLLRLSPEDIQEITVNNTFIPGNGMEQKNFILDLDLTLNHNRQINIELQVANHGNWTDRSLHYLCRNFDSLHPGEDYTNSRSALHISILDFTLFPEYPEFYAAYRLLHTKKHYIYNDKFQLNVLDLTQTELATAEDKACQLDCWAALFKATTWEEIKAMAAQNEIFAELAQDLYQSNSDNMIRRICQRREDDLREKRWIEKRAKDAEAKAAALEDKNASLEDEKRIWLTDKAALLSKIAELEAKLNNS